MIFGLAIAALAYTQTSVTKTAAMSCCCSGDSCPMKAKDPSADAKASCCDKADSCPMKSKDKAEGDASCCGKADSCPMKKKDTATADTERDTHAANAEGCCCACCKDKKDSAA